MKRIIVLTSILGIIAVLGMILSSPVMARDAQQSTNTYRSTIVIKDDGASSPVATISSNEPHSSPFNMTMEATRWTGAPLSKGTVYAPSRTTRTPQAGELIDNWQQIFTDTFESTFPTTPPCTLQDLSMTDSTVNGARTLCMSLVVILLSGLHVVALMA